MWQKWRVWLTSLSLYIPLNHSVSCVFSYLKVNTVVRWVFRTDLGIQLAFYLGFVVGNIDVIMNILWSCTSLHRCRDTKQRVRYCFQNEIQKFINTVCKMFYKIIEKIWIRMNILITLIQDQLLCMECLHNARLP